MTESKETLKKAALSLALTELRGRLFYRRYQETPGSVSREKLLDIQREHETQRQELDALRSTVPECAGKQYWWDVPYDVEKPLDRFENGLYLPGGIYSEQDDFAERAEGILDTCKQSANVAGVLSTYFQMSDYVTLYADRKRMKANLTVPVDIRSILYCAEVLSKTEIGKPYAKPIPQAAENTAEYRLLQNEVNSVSRNLSDELSAFAERSDTIERFLNTIAGDGPFTDQESWFMGKLDSDAYYTTALYREYRQNEMKEKAADEIARLRYQMEQMKRQAAKAQADRMRYELDRALTRQPQGRSLKLIRCGYAFYLKEELAGLVIINRPERLWQIFHRGELSPYHVCDGMHEAKGSGRGIPEAASLMEFILQEYGTRLKPYSVLASRPKNASDALWRCWAEKRFAYFVKDNLNLP